MSKATPIWIILFYLLASTGPVFAAQVCEDYPRATVWPRDPHADTNRPFYFEIGPYQFAVPWKFLAGRPPETWPSCRSKTNSFGVQFWLSDGHAALKDVAITANRQPVEPGRRSTNFEDAVVTAHNIKYYEKTPPSHDSPEEAVSRLRRLDDSKKVVRIGDLASVGGLGTVDKPQDFYAITADRSILFSCIGADDSDLCQGYLDMKRLHLTAVLLVPRALMAKHTSLSQTLERLLQGWRTNL